MKVFSREFCPRSTTALLWTTLATVFWRNGPISCANKLQFVGKNLRTCTNSITQAFARRSPGERRVGAVGFLLLLIVALDDRLENDDCVLLQSAKIRGRSAFSFHPASRSMPRAHYLQALIVLLKKSARETSLFTTAPPTVRAYVQHGLFASRLGMETTASRYFPSRYRFLDRNLSPG